MKRPMLVALLALAASCTNGDEPRGQEPQSPSPSRSLDPNAPTVTLAQAGAEPRAPLRLSVTEGQTKRADLTMDLGIELEADGRELPQTRIPPITITLDTRITEVADNGDVTIDYSYADVGIAGSRANDEAEREMLRRLAALKDVKGSVTVTARGVLVDSSLDVPENTDASLQQFLEQLSQQASNLTIPLPEEPVGDGARWTATTTTEAGGIETTVEYTYTARDIEGDRLVLDVAYRQTAPEQDVDLPNAPEGTSARVSSYVLDGKGTVTSTLSQVLPSSSDLTSSGTVELAVKSAEGSGTIRQMIDIEISLESR